MKTFSSLFEEIQKQEEELDLDDVAKISKVVEALKAISEQPIESPEATIGAIQAALESVGLTMDKDEVAKAFDSDEKVEVHIHSGGDGALSVNAVDGDGEEIPGDLCLHLQKDGDKMSARMCAYFDDEECEYLDELEFQIPDEEESDEEKEKEKAEEGNQEDYPADEEVEEDTVKDEDKPLKSTLGVEEDEEECDCEDKENCTCGKKKKKKEEDEEEGAGEHEAEVSSDPSNVTKKGSVEVYEEYSGGTKYVVVHLKNNKIKTDIFDHKLDAYNQGLNVVGEIIEITAKDVHDTQARMAELKKMKRQKVSDAKKKLAARHATEAKKVLGNESDQDEKTIDSEEETEQSKGKDMPAATKH